LRFGEKSLCVLKGARRGVLLSLIADLGSCRAELGVAPGRGLLGWAGAGRFFTLAHDGAQAADDAGGPLAVEQPVTSHGCAVTFWRYLSQDGPEPVPADLGRLLRGLHGLGSPPVALPAYRPLVSVRRAIASSRALDEGERGWLGERCDQLVAAYGQLRFQLPAGMIHGDAYRGNLLRDGQRVVLADWDVVSTGPREVDLIPTLQATRFGLPDEQRDAFVAAYGQDVRSWDGYAVLRDIRELSTLTALLRDGHADAAAQRELRVRLRSIRSGDRHEWSTF
jgi:hypothetical protein